MGVDLKNGLNTLCPVVVAVIMSAVALIPRPGWEAESKPREPEPPSASVNMIRGKGFEIRSADGDFKLKMKLFGQLLYTVTGGGGPTEKGSMRSSDEWEQALAVRRARLVLSGNQWGEHNKYYIQLAFSPQDMQFEDGSATRSPIFDWYFTFDHLRDLTLQVGQYRVPFNRSRVIPYAELQFVDRTAANFEFNLDRDIGFDLRSKDLFGLNVLRYNAGVFGGEGRDGHEASDFGMLYVARLEAVPFGTFDNAEADLKRQKTPGLLIGAAYAFLDDAKFSKGILGDTPADGGTSDIHTATADIGFKFAGLSVSGEFYYRKASRNYGNAQAIDEEGNPVFEADGTTPVITREAARNGLGWFAQVGFVMPRIPLEPVVRYGQVHPLGNDSGLARLDELGIGINWYIFGPSMAIKTDWHHRFSTGDIENATDEIRFSMQAGF